MWEFFDNELELSEDSAAEFGAATYDGLSDAVMDSFDDYETEFDEIKDAAEEDVKEVLPTASGRLAANQRRSSIRYTAVCAIFSSANNSQAF